MKAGRLSLHPVRVTHQASAGPSEESAEVAFGSPRVSQATVTILTHVSEVSVGN